ncbi:MAG TPA: hypothetical protein V6D22_24395 [Candidatus Obscuribacterales bacterium]
MRTSLNALFVAGLVMLASADPAPANANPLQSQIESLRAPNHYWHRITWKKSLTEGLIEARRSNKPIFLWAFIDNPDEERC